MKKYFFFFFFLSTILFSSAQSVKTISLNQNWEFKKTGDRKWLPATVPGTVHTDLLNNKFIDDPYFRNNEKKLQWIESSDWQYRTTFHCDSNFISQNNFFELHFDGLDTYAKIFLNDILILYCDNMFREWNVDVKKFLVSGNNSLLVEFHSSVLYGKQLAKQLTYTLPGDEKVFTRKAQYQYGWDWGPRFVTCGIWRDVKLIASNKIKISSLHFVQHSLTKEKADVSIVFETQVARKGNYNFVLHDSMYQEQSKTLFLDSGIHQNEIRFTIGKPQWWWCNGLGEHPLYNFSCDVREGGVTLDNATISFGLRTLELVQKKDSLGESFYFKLNGVPVFMKGANYIPPDNFLPRVTDEKYKSIIQSAVDANMNMLRVWGGGVYEKNLFYDLCDANGILVWQDFMFACAMYPGDSSFLQNVRAEIKDNVKRLRNHPCIALWCGNNEIDEGWHNWGWQKQYNYSQSDSTKIWNDYQKLFHELIPQTIFKYDSSIDTLPSPSGKGRGWGFYYPSSPMIGWGHKESLQSGDAHYWGVWWSEEPFDVYEKKVGRFMSEYGFQSLPSLNTISKFTLPKDRNLQSEILKAHQKHPTGFQTIEKYMQRDYMVPKDFSDYIYVSQLLQAEGMKRAIEAHRRNKPYCMGTLYWQLNDCWPVVSWSSTDFYGEKKAFWYFAKHAFEKYLVTAENKNGNLFFYMVNDGIDSLKGKLKLTLVDFNGNILWNDSAPATISPEKSQSLYGIPLNELLYNVQEKRVFLKMEIERDSKIISQNILYFKSPKDLMLDKTQVNIDIAEKKKNNCEITFTANSLAKNVFVSADSSTVNFSDNYFDLLPLEKKIIFVASPLSADELRKILRMKMLNVVK